MRLKYQELFDHVNKREANSSIVDIALSACIYAEVNPRPEDEYAMPSSAWEALTGHEQDTFRVAVLALHTGMALMMHRLKTEPELLNLAMDSDKGNNNVH